MHTQLRNKTTLVTGVTSGIGREIAQLLAERGARVFGTVRNPQSANPIRGVEIVRMEVTDDSSVNEAVQSIVQEAGPVQLLVHNAGYSVTGALEETSIAEAVWKAVTVKSPRLRYPIGKGVALSRLRRFVPAGMFDRSLRKQFQLD